MRCLVVGADNLGTKAEYIRKKFGADDVLHWDGRSRKVFTLPLVDLVIILTGFISHRVMRHVRKEAKKRGVRVVYLKRGIAELEMTA